MTLVDETEFTVSEYKRRELAGELKPEMLLQENPHRYVIFPIQHADVSCDQRCYRLLNHLRTICIRSDWLPLINDGNSR